MDVHGLRSRSLSVFGFMAGWLHHGKVVCCPGKSLQRSQKVLEVEIILNYFLSGTFFSVTVLQPQRRGEACLCRPSATAELCASCQGRCSGRAPAAPQQNFKGLIQLGQVQEATQPGLGLWIQDQFPLPSFCLNWMLVLRPPA